MTQALRTHLLVLGLFAIAACGGGSSRDAIPDGGHTGDAALQDPDGAPPPDTSDPVTESCDPAFLGAGDGCDCGCGAVDTDCPTPLAASACEYDNCPTGSVIDPQAPTQCVPLVVPADWTCGVAAYGDGTCHCGCGAADRDCPTPLGVESCGSTNGCSAGTWPDPANPSECVAKPSGWTCSIQDWADDTCSCGCGVPDPSCPANPHISQCADDGCPSGKSPDPLQPTLCISNAPQDRWTCALTALADGSTCDCGCGARDPDCGANPTTASCEATHCAAGQELNPSDLGMCWEACHATAPAGTGSATCTNGGSISFGSLACARDASACSDGHRYEIECDAGVCSCRIDGQCVGHASTTTCSFSACGWSVFGP